MYQMIISDLDSTLLTTDKHITLRTKEAFWACQDQNMRIAFATARPWRAVQPYLKEIPCDAVIYHNGSTVKVGETVLGTPHRIGTPRVKEILHGVLGSFPRRRLSVEMNDTLYANFPVAHYWSYSEGIATDFSDLPPGQADKIIVEIKTREEFAQINRCLTSEEYGQICEGQLCLIMNRKATKLNGIKMLCHLWGIALNNVISFGDDYNDLDMIRACGLGVAVANAIPEVVEAADFLTLHNDAEGVAHWIEQNILRNGITPDGRNFC